MPITGLDDAIQIFTDGSKSAQGVGVGIAIFIHNKLVQQRRLTLHSKCSNNQAEQLAIVKTMETIKELHIADNVPREIQYTQIVELPYNPSRTQKNHRHLIDKIRKQKIKQVQSMTVLLKM